MKSNRVLALVLVLAMLLSVAPLVGAQGGEFVKTFDIPTTPPTEGPLAGINGALPLLPVMQAQMGGEISVERLPSRP